MKPILWIFMFLVIVSIAITFLISCSIPPAAKTISTISHCALRSELYFRENHKLPPSLAVLPTREGYSNSIEDGYGRQLIYEVREDRIVFISYGKDGKPGGIDKNADTEVHYLTHKEDGSLWIGTSDWLIEAERRIMHPTDQH